MKKRVLAFVFLLMAAPLLGQGQGIVGNVTANRLIGGTKPSVCQPGPPTDVWIDTTVNPPVLNICGPSGWAADLSLFSRSGTTITTATAGDNFKLDATALLAWDNGSGTADVLLHRGGANTLAMYNGGTAGSPVVQSLDIYEYRASASDYSKMTLTFQPAANAFRFTSAAAGNGTERNVLINGWVHSTNNNLAPYSDDAFILGASAQRIYIGYFGTGGVHSTGTLALTTGIALGYSATTVNSPGYTGAYTVAGHIYNSINNPTVAGSAVVTHAALFGFDAITGTHKALLAPGAVVVTIGVGPSGSVSGMPTSWVICGYVTGETNPWKVCPMWDYIP